MLNALKRIEARQTHGYELKAAPPPGPKDWIPVATLVAPSEATTATEPAADFDQDQSAEFLWCGRPACSENAGETPARQEITGAITARQEDADETPTPVESAGETPAPQTYPAAIELPPALPVDTLPSIAPEEPAVAEAVSLDEAMDQLQAFVAEASGLYEAEPDAEPDAEPAVEQVEFEDSEPPVVEPVNSDPYAATAQQILRRLPQGRPQVLLFTSPGDGFGTTMTLARLAPWLARGLQSNVLVVDANFRNPAMARWLGVAPTWRLPDVLANLADWAVSVQTTAHDGVSLLPGGSDGHLGRSVPAMSYLLRDLACHYGLVVVDAASLAHRGSVQLAAACDATYLVVRLGEASPRMVGEAVQVIHGNGGRLVGCVVVDAG